MSGKQITGTITVTADFTGKRDTWGLTSMHDKKLVSMATSKGLGKRELYKSAQTFSCMIRKEPSVILFDGLLSYVIYFPQIL